MVMIREDFLHFVWQFQYFSQKELITDSGDTLLILHPGISNSNAGPDFQQAKVVMNGVEWYGNVEIHIKSSDWINHSHQQDPAYNNVILHVVWQKDKEVKRKDGTTIPTFELKERVNKTLVSQYFNFISENSIPCKAHLSRVEPIVVYSMLDKSLMQRLEEKANAVKDLLQKNANNWEETAYQVLSKNFGFKINSDPFLRLSQNLPLKVLLKHRDNLVQLEALLLGQAGLLEEDFKDDYPALLKREYNFLSYKYAIYENRLNKVEWKFSKVRPANFPTVRLSEFAALIHHTPNFFSKLLEWDDIKEIYNSFSVKTSLYWKDHFVFQKAAKMKPITLGRTSINNIIINTVVPLLVCYAKEKGEQSFIDKALSLLDAIPAEENKITRIWTPLGQEIRNAFDSQAYIELYNNYCTNKRCLNCKIGVSILSQNSS